jgi:hypothetical protein
VGDLRQDEQQSKAAQGDYGAPSLNHYPGEHALNSSRTPMKVKNKKIDRSNRLCFKRSL